MANKMIDFNKLIDDYVYRENRPKTVGRYYPSEAGTCIRKVWYSYKYPTQIKTDLLKIFEMGNVMHDFIIRVLKSDKMKDIELLKSELPFKLQMDNFLISGRVDNVLLVKSSGKTIVVEVKSSGMLKAVNKPQRHNVIQLQLYMYATGIHNGLLVYLEKNTLQAKVFDIAFDELMVKDILNRFNELHEHLITNTVPPAEAKITSSDIGWMCRFCEYKEKCGKE
jgi:CRISPR/Cas system-associated exonuclease Cas4 (RecB family)